MKNYSAKIETQKAESGGVTHYIATITPSYDVWGFELSWPLSVVAKPVELETDVEKISDSMVETVQALKSNPPYEQAAPLFVIAKMYDRYVHNHMPVSKDPLNIAKINALKNVENNMETIHDIFEKNHGEGCAKMTRLRANEAADRLFHGTRRKSMYELRQD